MLVTGSTDGTAAIWDLAVRLFKREKKINFSVIKIP